MTKCIQIHPDDNVAVALHPVAKGEEIELGGVRVTAAEDILTAHPDIVAIMGINDSGCLGAYETVVAQGIDQSKFFIGGNDGTEQALRLIKEGTCYRGSVDLNPVETGRLMIDYAIAACNGQEIPHEYMVPVAAVNIDNVDQYLSMYE